MLKIIENSTMHDVETAIRDMLAKSSESELVRQLAVEITSVGDPIVSIYNWTKSNVTYVSDPVIDNEDAELFISPVRMAKDYYSNRPLAGDCDDHALLNTALFRSIGLQSNVVILDQLGNGWNHAISQVFSTVANRYIFVDTTNLTKPLGWIERYVRRLDI